MRVTVQIWPHGGYVIVPHGQPPFPAIFATRAQALTYADALTATPAMPTYPPAESVWSSDRTPTSPPAGPVDPSSAATPLEDRDVVTRGRWATDNPVIGEHSEPGDADDRADATGRHAPRHFPRGAVAEERARRAGLTPSQYHLLLAVREHPAYPAVTITALAERLRLRHQSASRRVAHATARGLLHRSLAATDHRLVLVSLTDTGARALGRVTRATPVDAMALRAADAAHRPGAIPFPRMAEASGPLGEKEGTRENEAEDALTAYPRCAPD